MPSDLSQDALVPDLSALPRLADPLPSPLHSSHPIDIARLPGSYYSALVAIRERLPKELRTPKVAIVCGSGLQGLAEVLKDRVLVSYSDIDGFGESTVRGHQSALAFGFLGKNRTPVVCQLGRLHAYEGHKLEDVVYPIRILRLLGASIAILTNAAGGLNSSLLKVGSIVALVDHISLPSLTSMNPLIGSNKDQFGPRFPPMSDAYDYPLRLSLFRAAHELGLLEEAKVEETGGVVEGVYAWVAGPTYETRAEQRFLKAAGADVVGMSTVPEVIAARVLTLSLCTNMVVATPYRLAAPVAKAENDPAFGANEGLQRVRTAVGEVLQKEEVANHQEVLDVSARRADDMRTLVERTIERVFGEDAEEHGDIVLRN
uniref:purine-nucleoside phosphorylase n=1 Tax=Rhodotorula toruloides TaxID=5286 RepID=A0A0K3CNQ3_RHOTO